MITDRFSGRHSSASSAAVEAFEPAVDNLAKHRAFGPDLDAALTVDPDLVAAHALRGLALVLMANAASMQAARDLVDRSRSALAAAGGGTASERALVEAHALAAAGKLRSAAACLEAHLALSPRDFLAAKLAHALRFMSGEASRMLKTTSLLLPEWSPDVPGYGHLLGCHSFGLEETGLLAEADRFGRLAVDAEPYDVWGLHAVAHVMEMRGQTELGSAWLEPTRALWSPCGSFGFHLAWHLALFRLAAADHASALALYDNYVVPTPASDFRDVANAVSLLWRLEQEGVDTDDRWEAVSEIAAARRRDATYVFASLHHLIALVAAGRTDEAEDVVTALDVTARSGANADAADQARVSADVGLRLAEVICALGRRGEGRAELATLARRLPALGGSNAQRDVFLRTLLLIAAGAGDHRAVATIADVRGAQRRRDRFIGIVERRLASTITRSTLATAANASW